MIKKVSNVLKMEFWKKLSSVSQTADIVTLSVLSRYGKCQGGGGIVGGVGWGFGVWGWGLGVGSWGLWNCGGGGVNASARLLL